MTDENDDERAPIAFTALADTFERDLPDDYEFVLLVISPDGTNHVATTFPHDDLIARLRATADELERSKDPLQ